MNKLHAVVLDWKGAGALIEPLEHCKDEFDLAVKFLKDNMTHEYFLNHYSRAWVVCEYENEKPVKVFAVAGIVSRPDIPLFRFAGERGPEAADLLYRRINSYLADQGYRGQQAFVFVSESCPEEKMCPDYKSILKLIGAEPSERWVVTCR
jgi:hypothetical protein